MNTNNIESPRISLFNNENNYDYRINSNMLKSPETIINHEFDTKLEINSLSPGSQRTVPSNNIVLIIVFPF